jgi:hypothetical protein
MRSGWPPRNHVVLADDLEPVDRRIAVQDFIVVLGAQPKTETKEWRLGRIHLPIRRRLR